MKNLLLTLKVILSLTAVNGQTKKFNVSGRWDWEKTSSTSTFDLELKQSGDSLTGYYCAIAYNGDKIDCALSYADSCNLHGQFDKFTAIITFVSCYNQATGRGIITYDPKTDKLKWELDSSYWNIYAPDSAVLFRHKYYFDKDKPFEILNTKAGITKQSSDKDTTKCKDWAIPQSITYSIIHDSKVIEGPEWHDNFGVFPCIISGQLRQNEQTYKFEINGGSWMYVYCSGKTIILGSYKKEYEKYFIDKAWDGN